MSDGDRPSAGDVSVAEPTEETAPRTRSFSRRVVAVAVVVVLCGAAVAIPVALRASDDSSPQRKADDNQPTKRVDARQARVTVGAALAATLSSGSYRVHSIMSETPGSDASYGGRGVTIVADATINLDPPAMVATAALNGGGQYTSWTDGTRQWEQGGGNYGLVAGTGMGPGEPISGFSNLVVGTLGPREGGVAMMSLASPSGYLVVADEAITAAAPVGTTTLDGAHLTEYQVLLDASQLVHRPGLTDEQVKTAAAALALLQRSGYAQTTVRLGIDDAGFVRRARVVWSFADGGAVTSDGTFSDFGCAGTVVLPTQAPAPPPAATCVSPDPEAVTPTTTFATTPVTTAPAGAEHAAPDGIEYAYGHFFDPDLTLDQRIALVEGGDELRGFIADSFARHASEAAAGEVIVDRMAVHGNTADVTFHALYGGHESPVSPGQLEGTAVLEGATWKISRDTFCMLSANDGEVCPPLHAVVVAP